MATLDELFTRYGYPADEMNEKIYFYFRRADKIETFDRVQQADKDAEEKITSLCVWIELLKEYRKTLYARAQELCAADYSMKLTLRRRVDLYSAKKYYEVKVLKILSAPNARPIEILSEDYSGKERHKAIKRFEELKKQYPNIETEKDIAFRQLAGAWANDPEADAMTSAIRDGRTSNHTRQLASFDE